MRSRAPLRVGFVVASRRGPAWVADVMADVGDMGDVVAIDVVVTGAAGARVGPVSRTLLRGYGWIDDRVFGRADDPDRIVDLAPAIDRIAASGRRAEAEGDPDLVIRLDGGTSPVQRWPAPPLATWALVHGAGLPAAARPERFDLSPGGPEMLFGRSFTVSQLVATSGTDSRVIGQVVSSVDRLSLRRGARGHVRKVTSLLARIIASARAHGVVPDPIVESKAVVAAARQDPTLGTMRIALGLARVLVGYPRRLLVRTFAPERWVVAISRDGRDPRAGGGAAFRFLDAPDGIEWADPFPIRTPDVDLVFLEEYVRATHRGRLAVVRLDGSPRGWASVETILDLPTHLSYPFVFEWSGSWYLLPEQAATGGLQLYRAETFPTTWRWHSTALDEPVSDATIVQIEGRWWMFAAINAQGGVMADELHLFHADSPLGPWTAHARNPVVSDVRTARPAGRVYRHGDHWYRVAQDGAISYGHSISIVRIDRIDLDDYRETVVDVIRPDWEPGLIGTHTINSDDGLTVVDALRTERRLRSRRPPA